MRISLNTQLDNTQLEYLVEYSTYVDQVDKSIGTHLSLDFFFLFGLKIDDSDVWGPFYGFFGFLNYEMRKLIKRQISTNNNNIVSLTDHLCIRHCTYIVFIFFCLWYKTKIVWCLVEKNAHRTWYNLKKKPITQWAKIWRKIAIWESVSASLMAFKKPTIFAFFPHFGVAWRGKKTIS